MALALGGCGDDEPAWCASSGPPQVSCAGPHCVLGVVVDYKRLEPRGYRVFALDGDAINRAKAETIARDHVETVLGGEKDGVTDCERDEDFLHCIVQYPTADRWLLVLHGLTGEVVYVGFEEWAGSKNRGADAELPAGFLDGRTLGCAGPAPEPERKQLILTNTGPLAGPPPSSARDALGVARETDAVVQFVGDKTYSAMVINRSPAIGGIDPESTDWLVWLYLR
ncbi:MAG: hypothetical protein CSA65_07850 [Proteobacteria bacterium]|nr:MAG: hypothetical protein CSA65_07850 [Pseudomonadota bacterium]